MDGRRSVPVCICAFVLAGLAQVAHAQTARFMQDPGAQFETPSQPVVVAQPPLVIGPDGQPASPAEAEPVTPPVAAQPAAPLPEPDEPMLDVVEFRKIPLSEAARILSDQSGLKIVPSSEAGDTVVSLYLKNVRPRTVVSELTQANGLFFREDPESGVIRIYTVDEYNKDLGSFRDEMTEVFTLLYPNPVDVAIAIRGLYGQRVQLSLGSNDIDKYQDLIQRFTRFNLIEQQNRALSGQLGGIGTGAGGVGGVGGVGGGGFGGGLGGGGIGSGLGGIGGAGLGGIGSGLGGMGTGMGGYGGGMGSGMGGFGLGGGLGGGGFGGQGGTFGALPGTGLGAPRTLEGLTAEQIQALEEARTASGQIDETPIDELLRSRGASIFVTAIPRNNQIVIRTADTETMKRLRELISCLDVPTPLVLLEVKVLLLSLTDNFTSIFDYQFDDGARTALGFTTGNILPPAADAAGLIRDSIIAPSLVPGVPNLAPSQNATFQVVSANFRARIQLLETKNRVTQLASPVLLTANNEVSRIFVGQFIPIVIGYTQPSLLAGSTIGTTAAVQPGPITQLTNVGQGLLITPNINADRTVSLRLAQQTSTVSGTTSIPIVTASGGTASLPISIVSSAQVTGTIVAKDGLTVAMGGLIQESLGDSRNAVPILGKLPIVGLGFRNQITNKTRNETVVMIRPYVFNTPQEAAQTNADLIRELSLHPKAPLALGTMDSFGPAEILTASPPDSPLQTIFRFHSIDPKVY